MRKFHRLTTNLPGAEAIFPPPPDELGARA